MLQRLPGYDGRTCRSESAVFGIIGLAGAAVIAAALIQETRFAGQRARIIGDLSHPAAVELNVAATHPSPTPLTNATVHRTVQPAASLPCARSQRISPQT
jgi:hypothetical protein